MRWVRRLLHVCKCGLVPVSASLEHRRRYLGSSSVRVA